MAGLHGTIFEKGELRAGCELLDEYFYTYEKLNVNKVAAPDKTYMEGDRIALAGESYAYPEFFDILILKDNLAVKIRHGIVEDIISVDDYEYIGLPVVNGRGYELLIRSQEDLSAYRTDNSVLDAVSEMAILNRWLKPESYRRIRFSRSYQDIDYVI